jgi:hypothetical protein
MSRIRSVAGVLAVWLMLASVAQSGKVVVTTFSPQANELFKATTYRWVQVQTNPGEYPPVFQNQVDDIANFDPMTQIAGTFFAYTTVPLQSPLHVTGQNVLYMIRRCDAAGEPIPNQPVYAYGGVTAYDDP